LPQAHRALGTPNLSTKTALPAWRTAWNGVAEPLVNRLFDLEWAAG
jgi:hypothetical protein